MRTERRTSAKRIDVNRPVDILDGDGTEITAGFTRNLCEGGMRARVDDLSVNPGANILIRLHLEDDREPVVRTARIVWCARDLYESGAEVGLRLVEEGEPAPGSEGAGESSDPARCTGLLAEGREVLVDSGGLILTAMVTAVDPPDKEGRLLVTLKVVEESMDCEEPDPEQWKARPFRDAAREVRRYAGPVLKRMAVVLAFVARIIADLAVRTFGLLPATMRGRISDSAVLIARSALVRTFKEASSTMAGALGRLLVSWRSRVLAWRRSRMAVNTGD